ncbi:hypothetical protein SAY87_018842 [Trapa incisa]|uniref:ABC transporter domain-containing protein n=1 Tax=Trapa incisa TaxID=236973 RepID=A0AAN7K0K2_9MYRT|nr:hypothetical protein SAY87_018842 [Trapa incisa]
MVSLLTAMKGGCSRLGLNSHEQRLSAEIQDIEEPQSRELSVHCKDENTRNGVYMTWEDLWVTASNGRERTKPILQGLTGYARPGKLLALMGPSGCGKTTLLDALAGRLGTSMRKTGDILVNGQKQALAYGISAYVTQDETLVTTLTVREAVHYSAELQLPASMSKAEKRERADATIREMGLQDAMDTIIGSSWGPTGKTLSSGQKRRVAICLEILTHPKLLFLDEPTSGLDSAASYYVMKRIVGLNHQMDGVKRTIIASIHQPSSEVFQLFDSLCLLSSGKTVFFGPATAANEFFSWAGFACPLLHNPSDHFLKTINKDFAMGLEQGQELPVEEAIDTLIGSYKTSTHYLDVAKHVAEIRKHQAGAEGFGRLKMEKRNKASGITQYSVLTKRSFVNMYRDVGYYWFRFAINLCIALSVGTIFHDVGYAYESIQARGSIIMFISSFSTYMAVGSFPSFGEDMKVFTRERLNGHYGTGAFVLANTISSMPYLMMLTIIPGTMTYYLTGMNQASGCFIYFLLLLLVSMMLVESLMMFIASIIPNFMTGIIIGTGIQGIMLLAAGIFQLPGLLPKPFWKYPMYYISFHRYIYQGMCKNEFLGQEFQVQLDCGGQKVLGGDRVLEQFFQISTSDSKWVDLLVLLCVTVFYKLLFFAISKFNETLHTRIVSLRAAATATTPIQAPLGK